MALINKKSSKKSEGKPAEKKAAAKPVAKGSEKKPHKKATPTERGTSGTGPRIDQE